MVPTAMPGFARRRSRGRRSISTVAPTITRIATPRLPMMSNVVPLCGPAVRSDDAGIWGNDPPSSGIDPEPPVDGMLPKDTDQEPPDDDPPSAVLRSAPGPASSRDMPYAAAVRAAPKAARRF